MKDTTCTAQFKIIRDERSEKLFDGAEGDLYFLAWTTTPWTLPSNTALAVGPEIEYVRVKCRNPYTDAPQTVILAKELLGSYFTPKMEGKFEITPVTYKGPQLIDRIWGSDYVGDTKTLDVHVKRVRAKIEEDPGHPKYLTTVRGLGYKIDTPSE